MKLLETFCYKAIQIIYIIISLIILNICLFLSYLDYAYKKPFSSQI